MTYEINGDVTTVYDKKGSSFLIDTDQLSKVLLMSWSVDKRKGYVRSTKKYKRIQLHRYLLGVNKTIDHINRNPRDNRLCNLRVCTVAENNLNKGVRKDNALGVKGVTYEKGKTNPYKVRIQYNGKRISLGYYKTLDEATKVYNEKAKEMFKDFCPLYS